MALPSTNISKNVDIIKAYDTEKDGKIYLVYWLQESSILGVTDLDNQVYYTVHLQHSERKKFMGNMADTILPNAWNKIFREKQFKLKKIDEESAQLEFIPTKSLELPRVENVEQKIASNKDLLYTFYKFYKDAEEKSAVRRPAQGPTSGAPAKKIPMRPKSRHVPGRVVLVPPVAPKEHHNTPPPSNSAIDADVITISPMKS